jgi:hypothetical protein
VILERDPGTSFGLRCFSSLGRSNESELMVIDGDGERECLRVIAHAGHEAMYRPVPGGRVWLRQGGAGLARGRV